MGAHFFLSKLFVKIDHSSTPSRSLIHVRREKEFTCGVKLSSGERSLSELFVRSLRGLDSCLSFMGVPRLCLGVWPPSSLRMQQSNVTQKIWHGVCWESASVCVWYRPWGRHGLATAPLWGSWSLCHRNSDAGSSITQNLHLIQLLQHQLCITNQLHDTWGKAQAAFLEKLNRSWNERQ